MRVSFNRKMNAWVSSEAAVLQHCTSSSRYVREHCTPAPAAHVPAELPCFSVFSSGLTRFLLCRHHDQKQLREERILSSNSSWSITKEKPNQELKEEELKQRPWKDAAYWCAPMACSAFFPDSSAQVCFAHSRLSPSTLIINQENGSQIDGGILFFI